MAGTLFGLPLSQQLDANGNPQSGCLLYIYTALTSTPVSIFADSGLATLSQFPLMADASGRIPQFWLADGSYRARLTTASGVEIFDEDSILAIGPSVASSGGSGGGGGGGGTVTDSTTIFNTGDMKWKPIAGTETGWVRANGRTVGSASSGASERASSDVANLYSFLWNNFSNTLCPVATGRGAGPTADFGANKAIGTLDMRGYGAFGLDDMGNSTAGRLTTGTPTFAASSTGAEKASITILQTHLPAVNLSTASITLTTDGAHTHTYTRPQNDHNTVISGGQATSDAGTSATTGSSGAHTHTIGGNVPLGGSGTTLTPTTISPGRLGSWYLKL